MLYIFIDNCKQELPREFESYVSDYFDDVYEASWFADDFVREIISTVDKSSVVGVGTSVNIYNEFLGNMPPQNLSSGCKGLILLYKDEVKINGDRLGDNCIEFLLRIAEKKDITISLSHTPPFPDKFDAMLLNNNLKISSKAEFVSEKVRLS